MKMHKIIHVVELRGRELELEIHVPQSSVRWGNNGIGAYEFWGQKGYDAGFDYIEEFEAECIIDLDTKEKVADSLREDIIELLYEDDDFMQKLENRIISFEDEMLAEKELEASCRIPTESIDD